MMKKIGIVKEGEEICLRCKSKDLRFDGYRPEGDELKQGASCNKCGFEVTLWAEKPQFWEVYAEENDE